MYNEGEEVCTNAIPAYWFLKGEDDTPSRAHLFETHADMLTVYFHGQFREGITLYTLGSLWHAFQFHEGQKYWQRMPRYDY